MEFNSKKGLLLVSGVCSRIMCTLFGVFYKTNEHAHWCLFAITVQAAVTCQLTTQLCCLGEVCHSSVKNCLTLCYMITCFVIQYCKLHMSTCHCYPMKNMYLRIWLFQHSPDKLVKIPKTELRPILTDDVFKIHGFYRMR